MLDDFFHHQPRKNGKASILLSPQKADTERRQQRWLSHCVCCHQWLIESENPESATEKEKKIKTTNMEIHGKWTTIINNLLKGIPVFNQNSI